MHEITSRWRSAVSDSRPSTQTPQSKRFGSLGSSASTGIRPQSTSRQHAPSTVRAASGQSVSWPPNAHCERAPSDVSSPPPQPTTRNTKAIHFIGRILPPGSGARLLLAHQAIDRYVGDAARHQLGDVEHLDLVVDVTGLHAIGQHDV